MTDMVTRVAEAIQGKLDDYRWADDAELVGDGRLSLAREIVRAAIAEMRIPTKTMLDAVSEEEERRGYAASAYESMDAEAAWPVMISAALKENEEKA